MQEHATLLNRQETCAFFGGIDPSTLYRGVKLGRYPAPVKVGPGSSRWVLSECQSALSKMMEARNV